MLRLPEGKCYVLWALTGWVSQFEIIFFSVFPPSWGPDQLPLCRWAFLIFKEGRWCMKQINCFFRNHICVTSHFSSCQTRGNSEFFLPKIWGPIRKLRIWEQYHRAQKLLYNYCFLSEKWWLVEAGVRHWTLRQLTPWRPVPAVDSQERTLWHRKDNYQVRSSNEAVAISTPNKSQDRNH
jgi:hypothetical protein